MYLGFRVQGLGFRVQGLGLRTALPSETAREDPSVENCTWVGY